MLVGFDASSTGHYYRNAKGFLPSASSPLGYVVTEGLFGAKAPFYTDGSAFFVIPLLCGCSGKPTCFASVDCKTCLTVPAGPCEWCAGNRRCLPASAPPS